MIKMEENIKKEIISRITNNFDVKNIILFGSYANGNPDKESDIDLVVILNENGFAKNYDEMLNRKLKVARLLIDI